MACENTSPLFVKIGKQSGKVQEMAYRYGINLADAITGAGFKITDNIDIYLNGRRECNMSVTLHNNDIILISSRPTLINVRASRLGNILQTVNVRLGSTVKEVLIAAGMLPFEDEEIWSHYDGVDGGKLVALGTSVVNGEILVIEKKKRDPRKELQSLLASGGLGMYVDKVIALVDEID